jgi:RTA1 like protein
MLYRLRTLTLSDPGPNLTPTQGRIVFHVVPKEARTIRLLWIPPRFVTPIFVACDILALLLQLWGAVEITSVTPGAQDAVSKANKGKKIAQIGVAVQLACFGLFSIIAVRFNFTSKRFAAGFEERLTNINEKYCTIDGTDHKLKRNWQAILRVTNIASLCILIRSVYRMVDFSLGRTGYTQLHEWCLYVFDALVIFPVVVLYIHWHPSKYLPYLGFRLPKHAR